jgi:hypothetical protein
VGHNLTSIGEWVFGNTALEEVVFCPFIKDICERAFMGRAQGKVTVGAELTVVCSGLFDNCRELAAVSFGNKTKSIGGLGFSSTKQEEVLVGDSVESIGDCAFQDCFCLFRLSSG